MSGSSDRIGRVGDSIHGTCGDAANRSRYGRSIQTIAQKTSLTIAEATAFYLGFTVGVDSVRRYHRLGDFLDDDEILDDFFGEKPWRGVSTETYGHCAQEQASDRRRGTPSASGNHTGPPPIEEHAMTRIHPTALIEDGR